MAQHNTKRKDYTNLLKELQKDKQPKQTETVSEISDTVASDTQSDITTISESIELLLVSIRTVEALISAYKYAQEQVDYEQELTQDLLHMIEFAKNSKEWYKYSTQLHECRNRRRTHKYALEVLKPLVDYYSKPDNKKALNVLQNTLGETRKIINGLDNKQYYPRILKNLGVIENDKQK